MSAIEIKSIFVSPDHGFVGRAPEAARDHAMTAVDAAECVAGKGLRGDRYFGHKPDYKGQVTFFEERALQGVVVHVGASGVPAWAMRRNVMVSGVDLNSLIGRRFEIDGVRFEGSEECAPCRWMDRSIGEGARDFLKGQGGLRARILSDGKLVCGPARLCLLS